MSAALLGVVLICCSSSAAGAGTFLGGFIPDTSPFIAKKLKKIIQLIITGDAKPIDCENLYKYMKEIQEHACCGICLSIIISEMNKL